MSNEPDTSIQYTVQWESETQCVARCSKYPGLTRTSNSEVAALDLLVFEVRRRVESPAQSACPDPAAHRGCTNCCYLTSARKDHYDATVERNAAIARAEKVERELAQVRRESEEALAKGDGGETERARLRAACEYAADRLSYLPLQCRSPEERLSELEGWIHDEILPRLRDALKTTAGQV